MEIEAFARAIAEIGQQFGGSVTSWGRTKAHTLAVGGFAGDPHTWWLGADLVYDAVMPPLAVLESECVARGLRVIREMNKPHDHYQPADFPPGPVTRYPV